MQARSSTVRLAPAPRGGSGGLRGRWALEGRRAADPDTVAAAFSATARGLYVFGSIGSIFGVSGFGGSPGSSGSPAPAWPTGSSDSSSSV